MRELKGWEVDAFRLHDRGERDVRVIARAVGRRFKTIRQLLDEAEAVEAWAMTRALNGEPEPEPVVVERPKARPKRDSAKPVEAVETVEATPPPAAPAPARAPAPAPARTTLAVLDVGPDGDRLRVFLDELRAHGQAQIAAEVAGLTATEVVEHLRDDSVRRVALAARGAAPAHLLRILREAAEMGDRDLSSSCALALKAMRPDQFDRRAAEAGDLLDTAAEAGEAVAETGATALLRRLADTGRLDRHADADLMADAADVRRG